MDKGHITGYKYIIHVKPIENTTCEPKHENAVLENHVVIKKIRKKKILMMISKLFILII